MRRMAARKHRRHKRRDDGDDCGTRVREICGIVRETGFALHKYLKNGHMEKVYENGLAHRLGRVGLKVQQQYPVPVFDEDGTPLGEYAADLLIEDHIIAEVKAAKSVADEHVAQLIGYLRGTRKEHGLLINFGGPRFWIKNIYFDPAERRLDARKNKGKSTCRFCAFLRFLVAIFSSVYCLQTPASPY